MQSSLDAFQSLGNDSYFRCKYSVWQENKCRLLYRGEVLTEVHTVYLHWHILDLAFHFGLPKYNLGSQSVL